MNTRMPVQKRAVMPVRNNKYRYMHLVLADFMLGMIK